jgi:hypothetical protein
VKKKKIVKKNLGGRPTKYIPDVIYPKITAYIESCGREQTALPTIEGLAIALDVTSETIRKWAASKDKRFSLTIKKLVDKQKEQLMNDGMYGGKEINQAMAIFLLKCNHGMREPAAPNVQVNVFSKAAKEADEFIEGEEVK